MSAPTLAFTATLPAAATTFMEYKLKYSITNQDTLWNAWSTWATASGTTEQKAIALKFSGRVMDFIMPMSFIPAWPKGATDPGFVTKYTGACLEDYSSGMGGFCIMEDNDTKVGIKADGTDLIKTTDQLTAIAIYTVTGQTNAEIGPVAEVGTRVAKTYRLTKAQFATLDTQWTSSSYIGPSKFCYDAGSAAACKKDGTAYWGYMNSLGAAAYMNVATGTNHEYFDYPKCTLDAATDVNTWTCQMYLPSREKQTAGYPALDTPGVFTGRFFAAYIPDVYELTTTKVTAYQGGSTGATQTTAFASIMVAAIASLMF